MFRFRLLPWEYGVRNLFRRPLRTALTFVALTIVVALMLTVVGFIRGLERSLAASGDPQVALVFALGMGKNLEYSSIPQRTGDLLAASVPGIESRHGRKYVSPELFLGTRMGVGDVEPQGMGLVRGVTPAALLVRRTVQIDQGGWPQPGEVLVGAMAATKLGVAPGDLAPGRTLRFEGRTWRVGGVFTAGGSAFESEIWCRLDELQQAMKRQDLSLVAMTLGPDADFGELDLFCKGRADLELQAIREADYYLALKKDYRPVRMLAWLMVLLIAAAGAFTGLNTMYAAAVGRIAELAMLQTLGFSRRAILASLVQEGVLLSAAAALAASLLGIVLLSGLAVRFTMAAFVLEIDPVAVLIGCGSGVALGVLGAAASALRVLRMPVVQGLKTV